MFGVWFFFEKYNCISWQNTPIMLTVGGWCWHPEASLIVVTHIYTPKYIKQAAQSILHICVCIHIYVHMWTVIWLSHTVFTKSSLHTEGNEDKAPKAMVIWHRTWEPALTSSPASWSPMLLSPNLPLWLLNRSKETAIIIIFKKRYKNSFYCLPSELEIVRERGSNFLLLLLFCF